jgi:3-oxoacyl-[acyl-carrier protein] reductase
MRTATVGLDPAMTSVPDLDKILRPYVIRRQGEPEDAAGMVAFLASPLASWITGQTIPVNGGYSMAL